MNYKLDDKDLQMLLADIAMDRLKEQGFHSSLNKILSDEAEEKELHPYGRIGE